MILRFCDVLSFFSSVSLHFLLTIQQNIYRQDGICDGDEERFFYVKLQSFNFNVGLFRTMDLHSDYPPVLVLHRHHKRS
jgi:hypothetical protein